MLFSPIALTRRVVGYAPPLAIDHIGTDTDSHGNPVAVMPLLAVRLVFAGAEWPSLTESNAFIGSGTHAQLSPNATQARLGRALKRGYFEPLVQYGVLGMEILDPILLAVGPAVDSAGALVKGSVSGALKSLVKVGTVAPTVNGVRILHLFVCDGLLLTHDAKGNNVWANGFHSSTVLPDGTAALFGQVTTTASDDAIMRFLTHEIVETAGDWVTLLDSSGTNASHDSPDELADSPIEQGYDLGSDVGTVAFYWSQHHHLAIAPDDRLPSVEVENMTTAVGLVYRESGSAVHPTPCGMDGGSVGYTDSWRVPTFSITTRCTGIAIPSIRARLAALAVPLEVPTPEKPDTTVGPVIDGEPALLTLIDVADVDESGLGRVTLTITGEARNTALTLSLIIEAVAPDGDVAATTSVPLALGGIVRSWDDDLTYAARLHDCLHRYSIPTEKVPTIGPPPEEIGPLTYAELLARFAQMPSAID